MKCEQDLQGLSKRIITLPLQNIYLPLSTCYKFLLSKRCLRSKKSAASQDCNIYWSKEINIFLWSCFSLGFWCYFTSKLYNVQHKIVRGYDIHLQYQRIRGTLDDSLFLLQQSDMENSFILLLQIIHFSKKYRLDYYVGAEINAHSLDVLNCSIIGKSGNGPIRIGP